MACFYIGYERGAHTFLGLAFGLSQLNAIMGVQSVAGKKYMAIATSLVSMHAWTKKT